MLSEQEQKLKDLKDLEEHTRNVLIATQDKIRELEKLECPHEKLSNYDGLQVECNSCRKLFLLTPSPF